MEQMQKAERLALKKLLEDHRRVVQQRDQLLQKQQEWCTQLSNLKENCEMQKKNSTEMNSKCEEMECRVRELEKVLQEKEILLNSTQTAVEKYRLSCAHFTGKIETVTLY